MRRHDSMRKAASDRRSKGWAAVRRLASSAEPPHSPAASKDRERCGGWAARDPRRRAPPGLVRRSGERRGGEEGRSRGGPDHLKKKKEESVERVREKRLQVEDVEELGGGPVVVRGMLADLWLVALV